MSPHDRDRQPVGEPLGEWQPPPFPLAGVLEGRRVTLEPLHAATHGRSMFDALVDAPDSLWTYMSFGPFDDLEEFLTTLQSMVDDPGWLPYSINVDGRPLGFASYLRIKPRDGVIEVGSITFSPSLQRTTPATEAIYLMIRNVFDLGYRRCEWKCDALNAPSRSAAVRLGFTYEGTFRQATHYKGRNRDTAWYAITDREWPAHDETFQKWLSPANLDEDGRQRMTLGEIREGNR